MFDADGIEGGDELGGDCIIDELVMGAQVARPDAGGADGVMVGHLLVSSMIRLVKGYQMPEGPGDCATSALTDQ